MLSSFVQGGMGENASNDSSELNPAFVSDGCKKREKRGGGMVSQGCMIAIFALVLAVVSAVAGMLGLYILQGKGFFDASSQKNEVGSYVLDRKQICELAFEQIGLVCDTNYECQWKLEIPILKEVEMGRAVVKVKGVYLAKFGFDPDQVKLWEFYPGTAELHVSVPPVKLVSIQTEIQEIYSEDESWLKKLQKEDRNEAMQKNRAEAERRAGQMLEHDPSIRQSCLDQLKKLLSSVGVRLVLVETVPPLS